MQDYSKVYTEEEDGFEGNSEAYVCSTNKENLLNWLSNEVNNSEKIYAIIKELVGEILIIKNINVDEEFQGQGNGGQILCDLINDSFASGAILLCDIGESQKEGFILEKFYESNDFKTILKTNDYPLMIYPSELADKIIQKLSLEPTEKSKPKI